MRRVVITGMGAITPVGLSVEEFWNSVKEGKTNFAEVTRFDSTNYRAHMAAEINNFNPKDYMDFKSAKRMELFSQYAVAAAKEAIEQSGLDMTKEDPFRVGCSVGSGIGSMQVVEKSCEILNTKGPGRHHIYAYTAQRSFLVWQLPFPQYSPDMFPTFSGYSVPEALRDH